MPSASAAAPSGDRSRHRLCSALPRVPPGHWLPEVAELTSLTILSPTSRWRPGRPLQLPGQVGAIQLGRARFHSCTLLRMRLQSEQEPCPHRAQRTTSNESFSQMLLQRHPPILAPNSARARLASAQAGPRVTDRSPKTHGACKRNASDTHLAPAHRGNTECATQVGLVLRAVCQR